MNAVVKAVALLALGAASVYTLVEQPFASNPTISTDEIEQELSRRATDASGLATQARCPSRIKADVGRIYDCAVRMTREPEATVVRVILEDRHGHYRIEPTTQTVTWNGWQPPTD